MGKRGEKRTFTTAFIERAACPAGQGRAWVYDAKMPGLALLVTAAGAKSFYFVKWAFGRPLRAKLGGARVMPLAEARRMAAEYNGDVARGADPTRARRQQKNEPTLAELYDAFKAGRLGPHCAANTAAAYATAWRHLSPWAKRRLSDIGRADAVRLHARIGKTSPVMANRVLSALAALYNYARQEGMADAPNPAARVKRYREKSRERYLTPAELQRLFAVLRDWPNGKIADYVMALLFTGQRRRDVQRMTWNAIDRDTATWRNPQQKTGDAVAVALTPPAMAAIERRAADPGRDAVYVFKGKRGGPMVDPWREWNKIRDAAGLPDVTLHDLRRTAATYAASTGASLAMVGAALGHRAGSKATAIYGRLTSDAVKQTLTGAADAMAAAMGWEGDTTEAKGPDDEKSE